MPLVTAADARLLLLQGRGLLETPARPASAASVAKLIERLGFVQVDSIQRVERAHHLILGARLDGYRATHLDHVIFRKRALFEHWTHDASLIPAEWMHHWKPRFMSSGIRLRKSRWFTHRLGVLIGIRTPRCRDARRTCRVLGCDFHCECRGMV